MNPYAVDPAKVVRRLLEAGGEAALHAQLAMHAVALEDAHGRIVELEEAAAAEQPAETDAATT